MTATAFRRTLLCAAVLSLAPVAAAAATLSIQLDQAFYEPGDTITMTIVGDSDGAFANFAFGQLEYSAAGVVSPSAVRFAPPTSSLGNWILGNPNGACAATNCFIINMIEPVILLQGDVDPAVEPFVYGVLTATAGLPGTYSVAWNTDASSGFQLAFFGLTNAPAATLLIVPEPTTAALLALGLVALASKRSNRRGY